MPQGEIVNMYVAEFKATNPRGPRGKVDIRNSVGRLRIDLVSECPEDGALLAAVRQVLSDSIRGSRPLTNITIELAEEPII
jgi:hypothetical protein